MNAPREHSAILSTFIKLPFVTNIFILSIFEWPFYTLSLKYIYMLIPGILQTNWIQIEKLLLFTFNFGDYFFYIYTSVAEETVQTSPDL